MKIIFTVVVIMLCSFSVLASDAKRFYAADNPAYTFMGRIDFSETAKPAMWATAAQVRFSFKGKDCKAIIIDELQYGKNHNYIDIIVDGVYKRIKLTGTDNEVVIAENLLNKRHEVIISKSTEAGIGYIKFKGVYCRTLLRAERLPARKIEFFGDSITSAMGSDTSITACHKGEWYDQTNGYMGYAAVTARALKAQYNITSASGIGMVHSCCNMDIVMPQVYDKISLRNNLISWDFKKYQPDVVTICLGQNDGIQDSVLFCNAYISFIKNLRIFYPEASIVCLSSPMADANLLAQTKNYLPAIVAGAGDKKLSAFFFKGSFNAGCDYHPSLSEHTEIARQLTAYLRQLMLW